MRKFWKNTLIALSALTMCTALGACNGTNDVEKATIAPQTYRVAKMGESVSLADVTAKDGAGNAVSVAFQVTDEQGKAVSVSGGAFTPTANGKYKVVCTTAAKDCAPVEFYVYATADGSAYQLTAPTDVPETVEWGTECVLPLAYGEHVVNGEQIADFVVFDEDGNIVHTAPDRFVANELGTYTVEYRLGDKKEKYEIVCQDTSAPIVILRNNMTSDPKYGDNFLLPYIGVIDASEDESKRVVKVYSEDTDREMDISAKNRITIDASRYFIYEIYVEDTGGRGATYQFRIDRAYNAAIDDIPITLNGNTFSWENTAERNFEGYPAVTGYEISLDGGETYPYEVDAQTFSYTIESKEFCSVCVREKVANGVELAKSSTLPFDGKLAKNELSAFDSANYLQTVAPGSYTPFDWNSKNSLRFKFNPDGYRGLTGGVMLAQSDNHCAMNVRFAKTQKVLADSVLVIKMYASDVEKWVRIAGFGKDSIGVPMSDFGWQPATWQEISLPVVSTFGVKVGDTLEGVQILFKELVAIADIRMVSLQEGLSGDQVANFDLAQYEAMVTVPSDWGSGSALGFGARFYMKQSIELDGYGDVTDGVLKMYSSGYAGVRIEFPRKVQVTDNSFLVLKLYTDTNHVPRLRKYGTAGDSGSEGFPLDAYGLQGKKWQEISVPVTAFGYEDGETLEGVEFTYYIGTAYISEISLLDYSDDLNAVKNGVTGSQVANYDVDGYKHYVSVSSASYEIKNGLLTFTDASPYNWQTLTFANEQTVSAGDYIVIRMWTDVRTRIRLGSSTSTGEDLFHAQAGGVWHTEWSYVVSTLNEQTNTMSPGLQTVIIPVARLGCEPNTKIGSIAFAAWEDGKAGAFCIDYIEYISMANNEAGTLADLSKEENVNLALNHTNKYLGCATYGGVDKLSFDSEEKAVKASITGSYRGVRIYFAPLTVQANTFLSIRLKYAPATDNTWVYLGKPGTPADSVAQTEAVKGTVGSSMDTQRFVEKVKVGEWCTVTVNPFDYYNMEIGSTISYVDIYFQDGDLLVKNVTTSTRTIDTLVLGDSYTSRDYWHNVESDLAEVNAFTIGISGAKVSDWVSRLEIIKAYNPKHVVIHVGVNDINKGQSGADCGQEITELITAIQTALPNAKVFYIAISENKNYPQKWEEYAKSNAVVQEFIKQTANAYYIDFFTAQREHNDEWANGGYLTGNGATHLNAEGYAYLTKMVLKAIEKAYDISPDPSYGWQDGNDFGGADIY